MMQSTNINIDLDALHRMGQLGVRRAAVFMGLGVNAASDPNFKRFQLSQHSSIRIVPDEANEDTIANYKAEFSTWIIGNGLRELIESLCYFLDHTYHACLCVSLARAKITEDEFVRKMKKYEKKGTEDKLIALEEDYSIKPLQSIAEKIKTLSQARNCLTHRMGVVGSIDCRGNRENEMVVKWISYDIYVETVKGEFKLPQVIPEGGVKIPGGGGTTKICWSERIKSFPLDSLVTFTPAELSEICLMFYETVNEIVISTYSFVEKSGIKINYTKD